MMWLEALWFFLPAGIANMAPVFAYRLPLLRHWNTPIDLHKHWRGKRIFGNNKTWRGLCAGVVTAAFVAVLQQMTIPVVEQTILQSALVGAALGFGALAGDAIASFFKRRRDVPAGQRWIPFDQTDYIIGGLLVVYPFASDFLTLAMIATILALYTVLHFASSFVGYLIGLKDQPV